MIRMGCLLAFLLCSIYLIGCGSDNCEDCLDGDAESNADLDLIADGDPEGEIDRDRNIDGDTDGDTDGDFDKDSDFVEQADSDFMGDGDPMEDGDGFIDGDNDLAEDVESDSDFIEADAAEFDEGGEVFLPDPSQCVSYGDKEVCTYRVTDINTQRITSHSTPENYTQVGDMIFFTAFDPQLGVELWRFDPVSKSAWIVKDINPGSFGSFPRDLIAFDGKLFFIAQNSEYGREIWRSDGSEEGTELFADLYPGMGSSCFYESGSGGGQFVEFKQRLYIALRTEEYGSEIWSTSGDANDITLLKDIRDIDCPNASHNESYGPFDLAATSEHLFFWEYENLVSSLWVTDGTEAGTEQIVTGGRCWSGECALTPLGDSVFFEYGDATNGFELWTSDGSAAGTHLVSDINEGPESSDAGTMIVFQGKLYFSATNGATSNYYRDCDWDYDQFSLYRTDGTEQGTERISNIVHPYTFSWREGKSILSHNGSLYFVHGNYMQTRFELWRLDGQDDSLIQLASFEPRYVPERSSSRNLETRREEFDGRGKPTCLHVVNDTVIFTVTETGMIPELWRTDGTAAGTQFVTYLGERDYWDDDVPQQLGAFSGFALFNANDGMNGQELWITDLTDTGTYMLKDINPITGDSKINDMAIMGGNAYFSAFTGSGRSELWRSDGTEQGTYMIKNPPSDEIFWDSPSNFAALQNKVFFQARCKLGSSYLHVSDGTVEGTKQLHNAASEHNPRLFEEGIEYDGKMYFIASHFLKGKRIFKSDGTPAGTQLAAVENTYQQPEKLTLADGAFYFQSRFSSNTGAELCFLDLETRQVRMAKDINTGSASSYLQDMTALDHRILFSVDDGEHGQELWVSDGTENGTKMVKDILEGEESGYPHNLAKWHDRIVFAANVQPGTLGLWTSDGSAAGTSLLLDFSQSTERSFRGSLQVAGDRLYYITYQSDGDMELWVLNQPGDDPVLLKESDSLQGCSDISEIKDFGGHALIMAYGSDNNINFSYILESQKGCLWLTDGSPEGTQELNAGSGERLERFSMNRHFYINGNKAFFVAWDAAHGYELWSTRILNARQE